MNLQATIGTIRPGQPQHVIVTYKPGRLVGYVDGQKVLDTDAVQGDLSNWAMDHTLLLGNEATYDRPWTGTIKSIAIFNRFMSEPEVAERVKSR